MSWVDRLGEGDVVRFRSGKLRTVLSVGRKGGLVFMVMFPILRCSWTRRGVVAIDRWQLRTKATGVRGRRDVRKSALGKRCLLEAEHHAGRHAGCCDVVGVFE